MADVVIFGCGQIAEVAYYYLTHESDHRVVGFTVDADYIKQDTLFGLPIVPFEGVETIFPPDRHGVFIAVGYRKLNTQRADKLKEARAKGYEAVAFVSPNARVAEGFQALPNTMILEHNTVQPYVTIGENTFLWSGNHIGHHTTIGANVFIASHVVISGGVTVGDNCFLGVNATLRDNISIGSHNIIGAAALILANTADYAVYPGKGTEAAAVRSDRIRV